VNHPIEKKTLMTLNLTAYLNICSIILLTYASSQALADDCGGIKNGVIVKSRGGHSVEWAYVNNYDSDKSQRITITPYGWVDYDEVESSCDEENSTWVQEATTYFVASPNGGDVDPETGAFTVWTPERQGSFQINVTLKDDPAGPTDDSDKTIPVTVNAFMIQITMQLIDNAGQGNGTQTTTLEPDQPDPPLPAVNGYLEIPLFDWEVDVKRWDIDASNATDVESGNFYMDYTFETIPADAEMYGGKIVGDLGNWFQIWKMEVGAEDIDLTDDDVETGFQWQVSAGVGYSITWDFDAKADCCEGSAGGTYAYSSTDGLGGNVAPTTNMVKVASSSNADPNDYSHYCSSLPNDPPENWYQTPVTDVANNLNNTPGAVIHKLHGAVVKAQYDLLLQAETAGDKSGKHGFGKFTDVSLGTYIHDVYFNPGF